MKITEALAAEHTIVLGVFDQIESTLPSLTSPAEIRTMACVIEGLLQKHASRETELAYAALDHVLDEQGQLKRLHQDHSELDARLKKVHATNNCAEARRLLQASIHSSREHFRLEERALFPLLEASLSRETLEALGQSWAEQMSGAAATA